MNLLKRLHNWLKDLPKFIHLCWWFELHGLPIPPYFVGGGATLDQRNWIIGADDNADPDACTFGTENTATTGQAKTSNFMLRFQIAEDGGGGASNSTIQLYYSTTDDPGTAVQVTTVSAIVQLSNGTPDDLDPCATNVMSAQAETYQNGSYIDTSDQVPKHTINANNYSEYQMCLQFLAGAGDETEYFFWVFVKGSQVDGTYNSPTCSVTTEVAGGQIISVSLSEGLNTTEPVQTSREVTAQWQEILDAVDVVGILISLPSAEYAVDLAEVLDIIDVPDIARTVLMSLADTMDTVDASTWALFRSMALAESADVVDAFAILSQELTRQLLESLDMVDAVDVSREVTAPLAEVLDMVDVGTIEIAGVGAEIAVALAESANVIEAFDASREITAPLAEPLNTIDTVAITVAEAVSEFAVDLAEALNTTDTIATAITTTALEYALALADPLNVVDVPAMSVERFMQILESADLSDAPVISRVILLAIAEALNLTDTSEAVRELVRSLTESLNTTDAISILEAVGVREYAVALAEAMNLTEATDAHLVIFIETMLTSIATGERDPLNIKTDGRN